MKTTTIFNGQLMQYAVVTEEEITVRLAGVEKPVVIDKDDAMYTHYKSEYETLKDGMVANRQKAALKLT